MSDEHSKQYSFMTRYICFLLLFLSADSWAQNEDSIAEAKVINWLATSITKYAEKKDVLAFENSLYDSLGIGNYHLEKKTREAHRLPLRYSQVFDSFYTVVLSADRYYRRDPWKVVHADLCFIRHGNKIVYSWFSDRSSWTIDEPQYPPPLFEYIDAAMMEKLSSGYKAIFGRPAAPRDFFKERVNHCTVLEGCLYNTYAKEYDTLLKVVKRKDIAKLETWLSSPAISWQLWAVRGFFMIKQNGFKLTPDQLRRLRQVKTRTGYVSDCGEDKWITVQEFTSEFHF